MNIVEQAAKFARNAHKNQKRRYTGEPYFVHLQAVATTCARHGCSKRTIAAAYLHDVVEDHDVTHEDLVAEFGNEVANLVRDLTETPAEAGGTRRERKAIDVVRLAKAAADAQSIKCADMIDNTVSIVRHDRNFAMTYLPVKRAILTVLTRAHPTMLALAWRSLEDAERSLGI